MIIPKRGTSRVQGGKGSTYRPVDEVKWSKNYEAIFGKKKIKLWESPEQQMDPKTQKSRSENNDHKSG